MINASLAAFDLPEPPEGFSISRHSILSNSGWKILVRSLPLSPLVRSRFSSGSLRMIKALQAPATPPTTRKEL